VASDRLGLVDFDNVAAGDPELDVGILLADLDFDDLRHDVLRAIESAIVAGWQSVAGPLDRRLVEQDRGHRHLRKALRMACAVRPDADHRASESLRRSLDLLDTRTAMYL
jgi:aminoglycoside phosphotransferase (APT) family kinase protein